MWSRNLCEAYDDITVKTADVPPQELLYYTAVIRPVLKYASPVWHYAITCAEFCQ